MGEAEATADDPAVAKELLDLVGMRGGADVEILRTACEQQVADAAADKVRDVLELAKPVQNLERIRIDVTARDRMLGCAERSSVRPWATALYQKRKQWLLNVCTSIG